jgi:hypothetical protein
MTHIADKNVTRRSGTGRIRRALPALGLVAAAISGYSSQSSGSSSELGPEPAPPLTVELIIQEATLLHYARAQGVGDGLREGGALLSERLERRMAEVSETVASARTDQTAYQIDMAYSAGVFDASEGRWSPASLENYVQMIDFAQIGIREIADRTTLRWEEELGLDLARVSVTTSLAAVLTQMADISELPQLSGPMGLAVVADVSGELRPLLDHLDDTAFGASGTYLQAEFSQPAELPGPDQDRGGDRDLPEI